MPVLLLVSFTTRLLWFNRASYLCKLISPCNTAVLDWCIYEWPETALGGAHFCCHIVKLFYDKVLSHGAMSLQKPAILSTYLYLTSLAFFLSLFLLIELVKWMYAFSSSQTLISCTLVRHLKVSYQLKKIMHYIYWLFLQIKCSVFCFT